MYVKDPVKRYYYNPELLDKLFIGEELQTFDKNEISWLLVHEWLRDFVKDAETIRLANFYLHSSSIDTDSDQVFRTRMVKFGFPIEMLK